MPSFEKQRWKWELPRASKKRNNCLLSATLSLHRRKASIATATVCPAASPQDAGFAGVLAYFIAFLAFYSTAIPIGELAYHAASGQWLDPRALLQEDGSRDDLGVLYL